MVTTTAPEGTANFRDLGGLPLIAGGLTRAGVLLRSDALHALTDRGRQQLSARDVRVVVDLRIPAEREREPDALPDDPAPRTVELSLLEGAVMGLAQNALSAAGKGDAQAAAAAAAAALDALPTLSTLYVSMLQHGARTFAEIARLTARPEPEGGVLVHCTAGKDRTGVAVALLLEAVGVVREAVVADYTVSGSRLAGPWAERMFALIQGMGVPLTPRLQELVAETPASAIEDALAWVDAEHGGATSYLRAGGLSDEELSLLRRRLAG